MKKLRYGKSSVVLGQLAVLILAAVAQASPSYQVTDVWFDTPYPLIGCTDINTAGVAVGNSLGEAGPVGQGFAWDSGSVTFIPALYTWATNDSRQVVGEFRDAWTGASHPYVWQNGIMNLLPLTGDARDINNAAQVVGRMWVALNYRAFLWDAGDITDLGTLGGEWAQATAISELAQVVGFSSTSSGECHAFIWEAGQMIDLGTLGGTFSQAWGVNKLGQVVGNSTTGSGATHAFLWENGVMTDLGGFETDTGENTCAWDINDSGVIVGGCRNGLYEGPALMWQGGNVYDLNDLIDPGSGLVLTTALAVNSGGRIAGSAGLFHGFILTPANLVPSPGAMLLGIIGIGVVAAFRRMRSVA